MLDRLAKPGAAVVEKPGDEVRTSCANREILCTEIFVWRNKNACREHRFCDHLTMARESAGLCDQELTAHLAVGRW
jgi:hypothetical protein